MDDPAAALPPGRAIAVFSDGTGNSAAKINKTNVWRLYQALDLRRSFPDLGELTRDVYANGENA